jgi:hypothetical protein
MFTSGAYLKIFAFLVAERADFGVGVEGFFAVFTKVTSLCMTAYTFARKQEI